MDPYKFLKISRNPNGSLTRETVMPSVPPVAGDRCISRDVQLDEASGTWFRFYRPADSASTGRKLPIIIYFHGGGFVLYSAATGPFDAACRRLAAELPVLLLSVEYRLAPEHRLPAAYEDALAAVRWVRDNHTVDPWLRDLGDVRRCFLGGSSSGGNIAYRAALECAGAADLSPVAIRGVILSQPYFGGESRTASELRLAGDRILPQPANDLLWELSLPPGADRDHEFSNPLTPSAAAVAAIRRLPPCLVLGHGLDPLVDRQKELVKMLEAHGVHVKAHFTEDGFHGVELFDPEKAHMQVMFTKEFVMGSPSNL